jgi:hypothetical protein
MISRLRLRAFAPLLILRLAAACSDSNTPTRDNPTPGITTVSPTEVEQGSAQVTLIVTGSDFVRTSAVRLNGGDRTTQFVSGTEVRATLPAADFAIAGTIQVVVVNPPPGGGTSNVVTLAIKSRGNPLPVIAALSPAFLTAGSAATTVTITGTGFMPQSQAFEGNNPKTTTFVSSTELRIAFTEAELANGASLSLAVLNPSPGGGLSNSRTLEVRTSVPTITSLGETQTIAGQPEYRLRVNGTGFVNNSVVRFNGAPRATTRVSAGTLEATLLEGDLRAAGTFAITVVNPAPGGGASNAVNFTLVNGVPQITLLPSRGASAGRSGFTLTVHGRGFVNGSIVRWNGTDRPTQYLGGTRLAATIGTTDVAQPGTAQITVFNPAPGGGTSGAFTMTIRQLGATSVSDRQVALQGRDIAYAATQGRMYVSIKGSSPGNGNSVISLDPLTGTIESSVFVGSEPNKLALSDDGRFLYVGLDGASAVRRVDLPALTPSLQWGLSPGLVAGDIGVAPGMPNTVAVSRQSPGTSPPLVGVTIYDDGVARPVSSPGHTGGNRIEFLESPNVLYGFNNAHTGFEFFMIGIDAAGARHLSATGGLISGFYTDIYGAAGRIYGTDGSVVDADQRTKVGSFSAGGDALASDPDLGRAFMLSGSQINVYDLNTFQLLGSVSVPTPSLDHPALRSTRLLRWGPDGLAFVDQTRLIILRSPIFGP